MNESTYRAVRASCLVGSTAALVALSGFTMGLETALQRHLVPQAEQVVAQASSTLALSDTAIRSWQEEGVEELKETRKATADLHDLIGHTDESLNGRHVNGKYAGGGILGQIRRTVEIVNGDTLPAVDSMVGASTLAIRRAGDSTDRVLAAAGDSAAQVGPLLVALKGRVEDPEFDSILANAGASMDNLREMTASGAHAIKTTDDLVTKEAQIILAPVSKVKAIALFALRGLGRFLGY